MVKFSQSIFPYRARTNSEEEKLRIKLGAEVARKRRDFLNSLTFKGMRDLLVREGGCQGNCDMQNKCICILPRCAKTNGYFSEEDMASFTLDEREEIRKRFDDQKGFLDENGCVLPRYLRSTVCLSFICFYDRDFERFADTPSFKKCRYISKDGHHKFCKEMEDRTGKSAFIVTDNHCNQCDKNKKSFLDEWQRRIKSKSTFISKLIDVLKDSDENNILFEEIKKKYL